MSRIAVGFPTGGNNHWALTWSLVKAAQAGAFEEFGVCAGSVYVDDARNHIVRWFLDDTDCDKLVSMDSDIGFRAEDLAQLDADDLDCVSGCYYNVFDGVLKPVAKFLDRDDEPDDPLMEVEAVGAGFSMLSRDLLEKMRAEYGEPCPWFAEPIIDGEHFGEDYAFCRRVREMGSKVYLDLRVQLDHYKTIRVTGPGLPPVAPVLGGGR